MDALAAIWFKEYYAKYQHDKRLAQLASNQHLILQQQQQQGKFLNNMKATVEELYNSTTGSKEPKNERLQCMRMKRAYEMNLYAAMNGYDLPISNPYDKDGDPAIRNRIFLHDCYYQKSLTEMRAHHEPAYYNFVSDVRTTMRCDADMSVKSYTNEKEYTKARTHSNVATDYSKSGNGKQIFLCFLSCTNYHLF